VIVRGSRARGDDGQDADEREEDDERRFRRFHGTAWTSSNVTSEVWVRRRTWDHSLLRLSR
jgi:hypothetical protein